MKVMVIDTVGFYGFSKDYMSYFKNVDITGHEPRRNMGMPHPHGFHCGYYAGVLLNLLEGQHQMVFVRIFDGQARPVNAATDWMLDIIATEKPDVISRSWGMWDGDNSTGAMTGKVAYGSWCEKYRALQARLGFVDFGAAGNSDENDADPDVDFPQQLMPDVCNIIGSAQLGGKPSKFSGDGFGLQCLFWGENVPLNTNGFWQRGSGTSFATPKAAGLCAYHGLKNDTWRMTVSGNAKRPDKFDPAKLPHVKWGWGNMEPAYQAALAQLPESLKPPRKTLSDPKAARIAGTKADVFWNEFKPERA